MPNPPLLPVVDAAIDGGLDSLIQRLRSDGASWVRVAEVVTEQSGRRVSYEWCRRHAQTRELV